QRVRVDLRRPGVVHARGPAAEDEPGGMPLLELRPRGRPGDQLAVHLRFAHATGDELAEVGGEVKHENGLLPRSFLDLLPPCRGGLVQLLPMPTCWACWNILPSETIEGAITISTCWNSAMSCAPQTPSPERHAPAKSCDPSSTRPGPSTLAPSSASLPTRDR